MYRDGSCPASPLRWSFLDPDATPDSDVLRPNPHMTDQLRDEGCVLLALGLSDSDSGAILCTASLVQATGWPIVVLHVTSPDPDFVGFDNAPPSDRDLRAREIRKEHRELEAVADRIREMVPVPVRSLLAEGPTAREILAQADRLGARLVVVGQRGRTGLSSLVLGSVSRAVVEQSDRPVLVAPPEREPA